MSIEGSTETSIDLPRRRVREQTIACAWCGEDFAVQPYGRTPKWCSPRCRRRAWEQRRAADSGLAAVNVVVQKVEVEPPLPRTGAEAARAITHVAERVLDDAYSAAELRRITEALSHLLAAFRPADDGPAELVTFADHVDALTATAGRVRAGVFPVLQLPELKTATYTLAAAIDDQTAYENKRQQQRDKRRAHEANKADLAEQMQDPAFVAALRQAQADIRSAAFREDLFRSLKGLPGLDATDIEEDDDDFLDEHPESYS